MGKSIKQFFTTGIIMQRFLPTVPSLYTPVPICTKLLAPTYEWGQFLIGLNIDYFDWSHN